MNLRTRSIAWAACAVLAVSGLNIPSASAATLHFSSPSQIITSGPDAFVLNQGSVTEFNIAAGTLVRTFVAPSLTRATAMALDGPDLFVTNDRPANVTEFDVTSGATARVIKSANDDLNQPLAIVVVGDDVVVASVSTLTEVNVATGALIRVITSHHYDLGVTSALISSGPHVFVLSLEGTVTELNATTGALVRVLTRDSYGFVSPVGIALSHDVGLVADSNAGGPHVPPGSVTEFSVTTGRRLRVLHATPYDFAIPSYIATDGSDAFITDAGANAVTEIAVTSGALIRVLKGPAYDFAVPSHIAVSGSTVLVENNRSHTVTEFNAATGSVLGVLGR